ncbi:MAG: hypothetical protein GVY24_00760 [Planctomycetes bacterium]|jgi:predicted nucleotidyltransferase|nr:hypothetical protein [Planctomycetota bacterium]
MDLPPLTPEFRDLLSLLNERGIKYLVIGGYAVGFHGRPRYTKDIDIWIASDRANAERIAQAVDDYFGATRPVERFMSRDFILRIGAPPQMVEIMTTIAGVEFETCYARRESVQVQGVEVPIIGLRDLRTNKLAAGRSSDLGDVDNLPDPDAHAS